MEDSGRVRGWLVAMTKQGEDRIWRGAEEALRYFDEQEDRARRLTDWLMEAAPVNVSQEALDAAVQCDSGQSTDDT